MYCSYWETINDKKGSSAHSIPEANTLEETHCGTLE